MSVFNEIFTSELEKSMLDENPFLPLIKNVSSYLNGITVHIPQYNTRADITVNGASPAGYAFDTTETTEQDLQFNLDVYRIKPFSVANFDELVTNYDKFAAVTDMVIKDMTDFTSKTILNKLSTDVPTSKYVETSGATGTDNSANSNADFKKVSYKDFINLQKKFNEDRLPQNGRYIILDATMYAELLDNDAIRKALEFGPAVLENGIIGKLAGINIMIKNEIATLDTNGDIKAVGSTLVDTDKRVGFAFHSSILVRAQSDVNVFTDTNNVFKFSSIVSAEQMLAVKNPRTGLDDIGAYLLVQG